MSLKILWLLAAPIALLAQSQAPATAPPARAFGVLPNYRLAELSDPFQAISVKRKFYIGYKDATDYPVFALGGVLSGLAHATGQHPDFGGGLKGYGHRYLTSTSDQMIGNIMTEAIMPVLLHQDPRYFRKGTGSKKGRLGYALSRLFVARNDQGKWTFNSSEMLGNGVVAGVGNAYYAHDRGANGNLQRFYTQYGTDGIGLVLKEFWPDIQKKLLRKK